VRREPLSVRERMSTILVTLQAERYVDFIRLFDPLEGRIGVTVPFLAILELLKESLVDVVQAEPYGPIHVRAAKSLGDETSGARDAAAAVGSPTSVVDEQ
jgi:segregation and condensation protein A